MVAAASRTLAGRLGLAARLLLVSGLALLLGGGALLGALTEADASRFQADLEQRAEDELGAIAPLIADQVVIGDYAVIERLFATRVRNAHIESIQWSARRGVLIQRSDKPAASRAPAWFVRWVALQGPRHEQTLEIGGVRYGSVAVHMSAAASIDHLWATFGTGAAILATALLANLLLVYALLRVGLRPLTALNQGTRRLGAGDHAVRLEPSGPPEMRQTIEVFNQAAAMIEQLHGAQRAQQRALEEARDALESRVAERTAELARQNQALAEEIARGHVLLRDLSISEERFRMLTALSSDWFWEQDEELRFVQITEGAHNCGGIPREAHAGKRRWELPNTELVEGGDWGPHRAQLAARQPFRDLLLRRTVPDGDRWVLVSGAPRFDAAGTFVGYRGVARDVTAQKEAELALIAARDAADAASRAKSEFLANMSHEIRTPMNGILGMSSMLLEAELPARQRHFVATMQRSAVALLKVINDILDFSKIESGKLDLDSIEFDPRALLDDTLQVFASAADAKGIELAGDAATAVPSFVRGDPGRIRQVLSNLIGNAIKFTERGEVVVDADVRASGDDGHVLAFTVRDSGIGIDADALGRIFEPFTQADGSTTRRYGGTGLGLTISRQLAAMMGGTIEVTSQRGQGSTFCLTVRVGGSSRQAAAPAPDLAGRRVLVVDDSATNLEILQHQLECAGLHATGVTSAREALDLLGREPFDIAILDVHMPALDGLALAERIRMQRSLATMRLVMLSSIGRDLPRESLAQLDVGGTLTKPVGAAQLLRVLEQALISPAAEADDDPVPVLPQFEGRVLLAEDNEVNQMVAESMLEALGLRVDIAVDGRQAVAMSAATGYDLVLMDCQMPEMDGFAATEAIRARDGHGHSVIVAVTAHAMDGDRERCLARGMDDYLSKPFQRDELARLLRRWLPQGPALEALTLAGALN